MTSPPSETRTDPAPAPVDAPQPLPGGLAAFLVFLSSGAVLVLETVSLRLVGPYVGITLQVTSSVIGLALAAIAYGAWTGGWLADRRNPRRMLAPALILAAIAIAVTLPLVRYAGEVLRGAAAGGTLLLTGLAVFVPAALLSAVTPMVVKLQLGDLKRTGQVVGRLSSIGTLGGITATLGTGFVLVATLPSTVIIVALAVVVGGTGLALGRFVIHTTCTDDSQTWIRSHLLMKLKYALTKHALEEENVLLHGRFLKANKLASYLSLQGMRERRLMEKTFQFQSMILKGSQHSRWKMP